MHLDIAPSGRVNDRSMAADPPRTIRAAVSAIPETCYDNPVSKGLLYFGRDALIYIGASLALLWTNQLWPLPALWALAALGISALFVVGHDAAHGALFRSQRACYAVGRLALLPSLHAYSVWALGHNRVHHGHTGCAGIDFVWHPLTREQYRALSPLGKLQHRIEWTPWGSGLYYLRAVWWQRMVRAAPPPRLEAAFRRDRSIVYGFAALIGAALLYSGYRSSGSIGVAVWTWIKVFAMPWLVWNYFIGVTVYLHHIAPNVAWYPRARWRRFAAQFEGTASYHLPRWLNFFWHNIYLHVPHHVAPRIPFYHLPLAAEALAARYPDLVSVRRVSWTDYRRIARRCKLYDFERGMWTDYEGRPAVAPTPSDSGEREARTWRGFELPCPWRTR